MADSFPIDVAIESAFQPDHEKAKQVQLMGEPQLVEAESQSPRMRDEEGELPESLYDKLRILPRWQQNYVLALRELGGIVGLACARVGVSRTSVDKFRAKSLAFQSAIDEAIEFSTDLVEAAVMKGATVGDVRPVYQGKELVGHMRVRSTKDAEMVLKLRKRLVNESAGALAVTSRVEITVSEDVTNRVAALGRRLFGANAPVIEAEVITPDPVPPTTAVS